MTTSCAFLCMRVSPCRLPHTFCIKMVSYPHEYLQPLQIHKYILYCYLLSFPCFVVQVMDELKAGGVLYTNLYSRPLSIIVQHLDIHQLLLELSLQCCQGQRGVCQP